MTVASIDIGTNTVLLLIAGLNTRTGTVTTLRNEYRIPRVGKGLKESGRITPEKIEVLVATLAEYKTIIQEMGCDAVLVYGTHAIRSAKNRSEIIQRVRVDTGLAIQVISPYKEATLAYRGCISSFPGYQRYSVIDIGGGSTEISFGDSHDLDYSLSKPIGVVNATEEVLQALPPSKERLEVLLDRITEEYSVPQITGRNSEVCIAIAGTPTTLACIKAGHTVFDEALIEGNELTAMDLERFIGELAVLSPEEVGGRYSAVAKGREDLLLSGTAILYSLLKVLKKDTVKVSTKGIRYGAVYDYYIRTFGRGSE